MINGQTVLDKAHKMIRETTRGGLIPDPEFEKTKCLADSIIERHDWARCPICKEPQLLCHITCPHREKP